MMRLSYAIKFDDFQTLQPPLPAAKSATAGFKGVLVACALIALLGVFLMLQGMGLPVGLFLIGLGLAAATGAYFYEQHSLRKNKENHAKRLAAEFERIHCRDERVFTAGENEFTASCKCGTVTRPWSELTSFSENKTHFAFNTKMGGQILPKSAFASEAQVTEFRALVSGKVNQDKPSNSPYFDFVFSRDDYRAAYWLHTLKGGGWRHLARILATSVISTWGCVVIWRYVSVSRDPIVLVGLIALLVAAPAYGMIKRRRNKKYIGSLRLYFSDEGLHAQYPATQSRRPWSQYIGFLENSDVIILYLSPGFYSVVPKRALAAQAGRFQTLLKTKLGIYDYRNPMPVGSKLAGSVQQVS
jgi:hypothetical protein